jgi:hypothetical protein
MVRIRWIKTITKTLNVEFDGLLANEPFFRVISTKR